MKVDIWSDVMCPFCYIGKRKFETALAQFEHKDKVEIDWHSFQLDPSIETQPGRNVYDYLAERKGATREWSVQVHDQVAQSAKEVGLQYNFDKAVIANSFDAHRLIQLAKTCGLGDAAEERLFRAYFTEGKNTADHQVLAELGQEIGLDKEEVLHVLTTNMHASDVNKDIRQAQSIGVRGVPFFVINEQYAVSGAQAPESFLQALQQAWKEYEKKTPAFPAVNATDNTCSIDGDC
jgi:predicted DsbA family dithiol-disulfide isomerase